MTRFRVEKFDVSSVKPHRAILFVGRSGGGKSVAMLDFLRQLAPRFDYGLFFTGGTIEALNTFRAIAPRCFIYDRGLDLIVLAKLIAQQRQLLQDGKERNALLVTDDCGFETKMWRSDEVRQLLMNGRHLRITWINALQFVVGNLPPDCRTQIGYWVCTSECIHQNKKRLHDCAFGCIQRYSEFDATFTQITRDWKVAVLDATEPGAEIDKMLFWYKATLTKGPPKFTIGKPIFWRIEREHRENKRSQTALSIVGGPTTQQRRLVNAI